MADAGVSVIGEFPRKARTRVEQWAEGNRWARMTDTSASARPATMYCNAHTVRQISTVPDSLHCNKYRSWTHLSRCTACFNECVDPACFGHKVLRGVVSLPLICRRRRIARRSHPVVSECRISKEQRDLQEWGA